MIDVRLERSAVTTTCGECNLSTNTYYVSMDVADETLTIAPPICLMCLQSLGIKIAQASRERSRQGT